MTPKRTGGGVLQVGPPRRISLRTLWSVGILTLLVSLALPDQNVTWAEEADAELNSSEEILDRIQTDASSPRSLIQKYRKKKKKRWKPKVRKSRKRSKSTGIDLSTLTGGKKKRKGKGGGSYSRAKSSSEPGFKFIFDLYLSMQQGKSDGDSSQFTPLSFRNFHTLTLVEFVPLPKLQLNFELASSPRYYEISYDVTERIQVRGGKIWIPFDDMNPHNQFSGKVNTTPFNTREGTSLRFLPDLWSELGMAVRVLLLDSTFLTAEAHGYITNGFGAGTGGPISGEKYPAFEGSSVGFGVADNNNDKAIGARGKLTFFNKISFGLSLYRGRWTDEADPVGSIVMIGADSQIRFGKLDLRLGYIAMTVGLIETERESFTRGGVYGEARYRLNSKLYALARAGISQLDERVITVDDQTIVGAEVNYVVSNILRLGLMHNQDVDDAQGTKENTSFTALKATLTL